MPESETAFRSLDGTALTGTLTAPDGPGRGLVALVHGAGVTREEGGFFTRLANGLATAGFQSLRFDLRAHGTSGGRPEDVTVTGIANDIRAAGDHLRTAAGSDRAVDVVAASFSGGAAALHAAHRPRDVRRLVLLNPRLDYHERYATSRPYVTDDYLTPEAAEALDSRGFTEHSPFALGRALLNEVHHLDPAIFLGEVQAPTLLVHGTKDTFVPVDSSRRYLGCFGGPAELLELEGAQHGFAVHDDPGYLHPRSQAWQAEVIERVTAFLTC
ncbi:alpha/beta fold hydrolase [Streptomyces mobaraensis NBRC 13819 = DSM 40847]|uniref:Alpha/beta hydrolase fold containing protein n=1 Tax=Streptomyces mobaraensis (strain ATCC 29032 / DSM 40847 / JCM 4168 / NBRC 13819 / NCIMB 11159 / IPCR 16-22) TaxID=1223523 RepID=M3CAW8_STRM1|nr:alpha/beta fold hydrolase [Streptomyces mobaraensis]EMF01116.1 alpha/beta hydrolase fold containing protein [Streptomyces mobaraensis NBRC 13819 = DSM 40847]QTT74428.1 alpha/beta fold hydrolase [Streptomyces mobaraensis NBRC 13819 = DSM 40847]